MLAEVVSSSRDSVGGGSVSPVSSITTAESSRPSSIADGHSASTSVTANGRASHLHGDSAETHADTPGNREGDRAASFGMVEYSRTYFFLIFSLSR